MLFAQPNFSTATDANAQQCPSVDIAELRVFLMKNSILFETTDILSAAAMFLLPQKLVLKDVQGRTSLSCLNPLKQVWFLERNYVLKDGEKLDGS